MAFEGRPLPEIDDHRQLLVRKRGPRQMDMAARPVKFASIYDLMARKKRAASNRRRRRRRRRRGLREAGKFVPREASRVEDPRLWFNSG